MRAFILTTAAFLFSIAYQAEAQDGKLGVQFSPWTLETKDGCGVGRNIIDADNWSFYTFWVKPSTIEVISSGGRKLANATLQVQFEKPKKLVCIEDYCVTDWEELRSSLRSSNFATLDVELATGERAGPFNIPLEDLFAYLFVCFDAGTKIPPAAKPKILNPEPEVNPSRRR